MGEARAVTAWTLAREVVWDDESAEFAYRDPNGGRALLELAPTPSWHDLQFRR